MLVGHVTINFLKHCNVLATCKELQSKYGELNPSYFSLEMWRIWRILTKLSPPPTTKKDTALGCLYIYLYTYILELTYWTLLSSVCFFMSEFSLFIDKEIWEILEKCVFCSVISTNFANFEAKLAKISTLEIWRWKKNFNTAAEVACPWNQCRRLHKINVDLKAQLADGWKQKLIGAVRMSTND
jgi:hypothetical protein